MQLHLHKIALYFVNPLNTGNEKVLTNNVLCYFQKQCSDVKYKLFQAYCTSLYGCELWNLSSNDLVDLCTAWRKGIRRVWGVPPDTHCYTDTH